MCQEHGGTLIHPSEKGYLTLTANISALHELNQLPLNINISRLDDGSGIEATLVTKKAKWHKVCYVLCNETKVERARKHREQTCHKMPLSPIKEHLRSASVPLYPVETEGKCPPACLFCDDITGDLHKAATMSLDTRVRQIATASRDTKLFAKLSPGDMIAIDAVYHLKCLTSFYNRNRSQQRHSTDQSHQLNPCSLALAEVVSYMEEYGQLGGDINHVFKLPDLKALYCERLHKLGGDATGQIHSTRLAQKLQQHIPSLEVHKSKSGTVLSFKEDIGDALLDAFDIDPDDEAVMLMRVAKLVRKEVFENKYHFDSSLCDEQYDNLPTSLYALVGMILGGSNARQRIDDFEVSLGDCRDISSLFHSWEKIPLDRT